jgi:hypothetical protein
MLCVWIGAWLWCSAQPASAQTTPTPQPVPEIVISGFAFDATANRYTVTLSLANMGAVKEVEIRLLNLETGENTAFGSPVAINGNEIVDVPLSAAELQPGRKYRLAIRAIRDDRTYVRRPPSASSGDQDPLTFASQEFVYSPPPKPIVTLKIDAINAAFEKRVIRIALHYADTAEQLNYEGMITDKNGAAVQGLPRAPLVLTDGQLEIPLPEAMFNTSQVTQYQLTLRLYKADNTLAADDTREFALVPPVAPALPLRLVSALMATPWVLASVGAVVVLSGVGVALDRRPRKRRPLPRPQNRDIILIEPTPDCVRQGGG